MFGEAVDAIAQRYLPAMAVMHAWFRLVGQGHHRAQSDIDLALWGDIDELGAQAIAAELDELPRPYRYDVVAFASIGLQALREHIEGVGIQIFPS